jgi:hypothetical protein
MYLTIDFWYSAAAYRKFLTKNRASYRKLNRETGDLTLRECHVVQLVAQAFWPEAFLCITDQVQRQHGFS